MDVEALRTFLTVAEAGQFQAAADELGDQPTGRLQADRGPGEAHRGRAPGTDRPGSRLSLDGQVFLPPAKKILAAIEQAEQAVRPGSRPLRVDVLNPARRVGAGLGRPLTRRPN
ncbi:hypothetical protein STRAU_2831 [Streptomyces aurantiacus JA 4570]|uniref:HTH lysR-type domain-containing protein n=1 Tax=Streptomyces aurantiacus JA 4570 TaxID=1286094 RepID=S4ARS8_9ACTN|nr:hypothetical protein STRAU_2831 [Streptomyces aurantiacus JA 4570]